jgi:hypothetical protein
MPEVKVSKAIDFAKVEARFSSRLDKSGSCWLWTGGVSGSGYGETTCGPKPQIPTHRLSWILYRGDIPEGLQVLHKCDVKICVNPDHLFLGTQTDNMQDCVKKGRHRPAGCPGESNPKARLTEAQVIDIRRRRKAGEGPTALSKEYGVSRIHIQYIVKGKAWSNVPLQ